VLFCYLPDFARREFRRVHGLRTQIQLDGTPQHTHWPIGIREVTQRSSAPAVALSVEDLWSAKLYVKD
jgi:hypothetical protein